MAVWLFMAMFAWTGLAALPPPSLQSLAGARYVRADGPAARDLPVLSNFWGSVGCDPSLDVLSLSQILLPPFLDRGIATGSVRIDGTPARARAQQWAPHAFRRDNDASGADTAVVSETAMGFERNLVLQRVAIVDPLVPRTIDIDLAAAFTASEQLSWTSELPGTMPRHRVNITTVAGVPALWSCDTQSAACAVWLLLSSQPPIAWGQHQAGDALGSRATFAPTTQLNASMALIIAATLDAALQEAALLASQSAFDAAWAAFASGWDQRWADAFNGGGHYSGRVPVLALQGANATAVMRVYYMSIYTILASERTNLPKLFPRVFLTGTGNKFQAGKDTWSIGGTVQFAWDQAFYGSMMALLDPEAARADLEAWIGQPIAQNFGIELDNMQPTGDFYAFNALSLYESFASYLRVTNDTSFLARVQPYLSDLASFWEAYAPSGSALADYSGNPSNYLECVPTYIHVTAALQGGNAYMARDYADLLAAQGNTSGADYWWSRGEQIANETVSACYVDRSPRASGSAPGDLGGWWRAYNPHTQSGTEVRHVIDFGYSPLGLCNIARHGSHGAWPCALNATRRAQMVDFAMRQLVLPTRIWMRALSLGDAASPVDRPDHGTTGAYDAWPAITINALVLLTGDFNLSVSILASIGITTLEGPFGQAKAVPQTPADTYPPFKTALGWTRYLANNGGAFADSILTHLAGYQPGWLDPALPRPALAGVPRGLTGTLACIRGPGPQVRFATAQLDGAGVTYSWSDTC
eukprot:m.248685 g.248685  ORF g.248685 m.248685 type:complete len:756 (+) comp15813_c0_seq1:800-3067(+)